MSGLIEGAVAGLVVEKLLKEVLNAVTLLVNVNKNLELLQDILIQLVPLVAEISKQTEQNDSANPWLQRLHGQLEKADVVVHKITTESRFNVVKRVKRSKEVIEITNGIKNQYAIVPIVGLAVSLRIREVVEIWDGELRKMANWLEDLKFSETTRKVVNTRTGRSGSTVNIITPSAAITELKAQVHSTNRELDDSAAPSNSDLEQPPANASRGVSSDVIFGDDNFMKNVTSLLLSNEGSKWVGIWAMGGAGKTLTAQRVYNDPLVQSNFVGGTFWLDVGREQTALSLLEQLYKQITNVFKGFSSEEEAKHEVEKKLNQQNGRVLLVLDDVWSSSKTDSLNVVSDSSSSGSKILVTTRDKSVLTSVHAEVLQNPLLSEDHSWQLFCWHAFRGVDNVSPLLKGSAKDVAAECKGLPLALKVIGSMMAGKIEPKQWEIDLHRLRYALPIGQEQEKQLHGRLQLSIDDLPQVHVRLRDCFYYFAAFPEDQTITLSDFLGVWIAEDKSSDGWLLPEEEAYYLLGHLIKRSLIDPHSGNPKVYYSQERLGYKIHDVLRDLIRHNLQHDHEPKNMLCLYQPGMQLRRFPEQWESSLPQASASRRSSGVFKAQKMSLMFNDLKELPSRPLMAPDLRVFLAGHNPSMRSIPRPFFMNLSALRVLDLKFTGIREIPATAFRDLKNLKLLDLSSCKLLEKIPDSIKHLENLMELHLNSCVALEAIPSGLRSLKKLELLNTYETRVWNHEQRGTSRGLSNLIPAFISMGPAILQDINYLTALVDLEVYSTSAKGFPVEFGSLKLLKRLRLFCSQLQSFPDPSRLTELESLTLNSCVQLRVLPEGIVSLSQLTKLNLDNCVALSSLPALDNLPLLRQLELGFCLNLAELPESFGSPGAFPSLEELDMVACSKAIFPKLYPGAMSKLKVLGLGAWTQLQHLPESLRVLDSLCCLRLNLCARLETLEPAFEENSFPCLEELFLGDTKVTRLPEFLASKLKLVKLDLRNCPAGNNLPLEFQNMERLKILR